MPSCPHLACPQRHVYSAISFASFRDIFFAIELAEPGVRRLVDALLSLLTYSFIFVLLSFTRLDVIEEDIEAAEGCHQLSFPSLMFSFSIFHFPQPSRPPDIFFLADAFFDSCPTSPPCRGH